MDVSEHGCERCGSLTCEARVTLASSFGVAVVGAANVGKSAICVQLKTRKFIWEYDSSGDYTYQIRLPLGDHCSQLTVVDTTHRSAMESIDFSNIHGVLLVFSIDDMHSFSQIEAIKTEIEETIVHKRPRPLRYLLVGNKRDVSHLRRVTESQGQELASRIGCEYTEVSARTEGQRVHAAFQVLLHKMRAAKKRRAQRYWTSVVDQVVSSKVPATSASTLPSIASSTSINPAPMNTLILPAPKFSSSSYDSLLSPTSPPTSPPSPEIPMQYTYQFPDGVSGRSSATTPDEGLSHRRSLKKSMIKRVSSLRLAAGRQANSSAAAGGGNAPARHRRGSKPSIESEF
ncbi:ras-related and estrogen-regulated growth inhibitor-like [Sycon ciliatum]|uniref:ras-related and estrogen-regulated growth inhibitor-like n=1 Tax=Sycon ciliatum TaxID=27933 RepID=UPI0020AEDBE2|eukprot:scpid57809/ scgid27688/ Ras-related and estrogen-regulated growth inhibitor